MCIILLHMCCMLVTAYTFLGLLITLTKKGLLLWKYILLTTTNTRTKLTLPLTTMCFCLSHVLKQKRISILHLILKGLLIILRLMNRSNMLHWLLIVSCRIGLMLWMRIGVRKIIYKVSSALFRYFILIWCRIHLPYY